MKLFDLLVEHLDEGASSIKVSELDFEPTLEVIKQVADHIGLEWENVSQGNVHMNSDVDFRVTDIPNQGVSQFEVYLSDDESKFIINVPNSAPKSIPNTEF